MGDLIVKDTAVTEENRIIKALHISPIGTVSSDKFLHEVKQASPTLKEEIVCLGCDQSDDYISKNVEKVLELRPYYIILSMPSSTMAKYSKKLFANSIFHDDTYRRENGLWVVTLSCGEFQHPANALSDIIDGYYSHHSYLIRDLKRAPYTWMDLVDEPSYYKQFNPYKKDKD